MILLGLRIVPCEYLGELSLSGNMLPLATIVGCSGLGFAEEAIPRGSVYPTAFWPLVEELELKEEGLRSHRVVKNLRAPQGGYFENRDLIKKRDGMGSGTSRRQDDRR